MPRLRVSCATPFRSLVISFTSVLDMLVRKIKRAIRFFTNYRGDYPPLTEQHCWEKYTQLLDDIEWSVSPESIEEYDALLGEQQATMDNLPRGKKETKIGSSKELNLVVKQEKKWADDLVKLFRGLGTILSFDAKAGGGAALAVCRELDESDKESAKLGEVVTLGGLTYVVQTAIDAHLPGVAGLPVKMGVLRVMTSPKAQEIASIMPSSRLINAFGNGLNKVSTWVSGKLFHELVNSGLKKLEEKGGQFLDPSLPPGKMITDQQIRKMIEQLAQGYWKQVEILIKDKSKEAVEQLAHYLSPEEFAPAYWRNMDQQVREKIHEQIDLQLVKLGQNLHQLGNNRLHQTLLDLVHPVIMWATILLANKGRKIIDTQLSKLGDETHLKSLVHEAVELAKPYIQTGINRVVEEINVWFDGDHKGQIDNQVEQLILQSREMAREMAKSFIGFGTRTIWSQIYGTRWLMIGVCLGSITLFSGLADGVASLIPILMNRDQKNRKTELGLATMRCGLSIYYGSTVPGWGITGAFKFARLCLRTRTVKELGRVSIEKYRQARDEVLDML